MSRLARVRLFSEILSAEIEVPEEPQRIVSLAPSITETLFLLGLGDRVVGVSHFCNKPPEAREKPRLGSYFQVNYKKLEELKPDLILVTTGAQRKLAIELFEKGYTVYPIPLPVSVIGVLDNIVQVGLVTGEIKEGRRLSETLLKRLASLRPLTRRIRVYYEIDLGGPVSIGAISYISDALDRLGLDHVFRKVRRTWIIDPPIRDIIEFNPEVIIYEKAPYKSYSESKIVENLKSRGLDATDAYKQNRIIILEPDSLAHYGPSLVEVLYELESKISEVFSKSS